MITNINNIKNQMRSFKIKRLKLISFLIFLACITLIAGCTRRHIVKYGGPPVEFSKQ